MSLLHEASSQLPQTTQDRPIANLAQLEQQPFIKLLPTYPSREGTVFMGKVLRDLSLFEGKVAKKSGDIFDTDAVALAFLGVNVEGNPLEFRDASFKDLADYSFWTLRKDYLAGKRGSEDAAILTMRLRSLFGSRTARGSSEHFSRPFDVPQRLVDNVLVNSMRSVQKDGDGLDALYLVIARGLASLRDSVCEEVPGPDNPLLGMLSALWNSQQQEEYDPFLTEIVGTYSGLFAELPYYLRRRFSEYYFGRNTHPTRRLSTPA